MPSRNRESVQLFTQDRIVQTGLQQSADTSPSCPAGTARRAKIYVGSGTDAQNGVKSRLAHYDNLTMLPRFMKAALEDGPRHKLRMNFKVHDHAQGAALLGAAPSP
jgi:hypothetical protein